MDILALDLGKYKTVFCEYRRISMRLTLRPTGRLRSCSSNNWRRSSGRPQERLLNGLLSRPVSESRILVHCPVARLGWPTAVASHSSGTTEDRTVETSPCGSLLPFCASVVRTCVLLPPSSWRAARLSLAHIPYAGLWPTSRRDTIFLRALHHACIGNRTTNIGVQA
jgi:hypothetical protein